MKTRMTELFGIRYPIMLAGMNWITEPKLVAAVCNAGGLGVLATAQFGADKETLRQKIWEIRELTDKPFGINQSLMAPGAREVIEVAIKENVPVINYSLGKPWFIDQVHAYGGKVLGTTAISKHAVRAEQLGCDAIVVTGYEAAAHGATGTSLVLIPIVTSQVKIPVIAAGGFYDGRGLAAALVLGASGISMGTRFGLTKESVVHDNFKQLCLKSTEEDTLYSDAFDGMYGRALKTKATQELLKRRLPLAEAIKDAWEVKRLLKLPLGKFIGLSFSMMKSDEDGETRNLWMQARRATGAVLSMKAIYDGDTEEGILYAGQCIGGIDDLPSVNEIMEKVVTQAEETLKAAQAKIT